MAHLADVELSGKFTYELVTSKESFPESNWFKELFSDATNLIHPLIASHRNEDNADYISFEIPKGLGNFCGMLLNVNQVGDTHDKSRGELCFNKYY